MKTLKDLRIGDVVEFNGQNYMFDFERENDKIYVGLRSCEVMRAFNGDSFVSWYHKYHDSMLNPLKVRFKVFIDWADNSEVRVDAVDCGYSIVPVNTDISQLDFKMTNLRLDDSPSLFIYGLNDWEEFKRSYGENSELRQSEANEALTKVVKYIIQTAKLLAGKRAEYVENEPMSPDEVVNNLIDNEGIRSEVQLILFMSDIFIDFDEVPVYIYKKVMSISTKSGSTLMEEVKSYFE